MGVPGRRKDGSHRMRRTPLRPPVRRYYLKANAMTATRLLHLNENPQCLTRSCRRRRSGGMGAPVVRYLLDAGIGVRVHDFDDARLR
ncbi:hypothetical protein GCM10028783_00980 [Modestobacter muralis]